MLSFYHGIFFVNTTQMDITRTPTFSKAALPLGCGCNVKTESPEGKVPSAYPPGFYVFVDSLVHIKLYGHIVASKVKCINAHSIFLLGTMLPS